MIKNFYNIPQIPCSERLNIHPAPNQQNEKCQGLNPDSVYKTLYPSLADPAINFDIKDNTKGYGKVIKTTQTDTTTCLADCLNNKNCTHLEISKDENTCKLYPDTDTFLNNNINQDNTQYQIYRKNDLLEDTNTCDVSDKFIEQPSNFFPKSNKPNRVIKDKDLTKKECLSACAYDNKCNTVVFSSSKTICTQYSNNNTVENFDNNDIRSRPKKNSKLYVKKPEIINNRFDAPDNLADYYKSYPINGRENDSFCEYNEAADKCETSYIVGKDGQKNIPKNSSPDKNNILPPTICLPPNCIPEPPCDDKIGKLMINNNIHLKCNPGDKNCSKKISEIINYNSDFMGLPTPHSQPNPSNGYMPYASNFTEYNNLIISSPEMEQKPGINAMEFPEKCEEWCKKSVDCGGLSYSIGPNGKPICQYFKNEGIKKLRDSLKDKEFTNSKIKNSSTIVQNPKKHLIDKPYFNNMEPDVKKVNACITSGSISSENAKSSNSDLKSNNVTSVVENASTKLKPKKEESEFQGFSKLIEKNITKTKSLDPKKGLIELQGFFNNNKNDVIKSINENGTDLIYVFKYVVDVPEVNVKKGDSLYSYGKKLPPYNNKKFTIDDFDLKEIPEYNKKDWEKVDIEIFQKDINPTPPKIENFTNKINKNKKIDPIFYWNNIQENFSSSSDIVEWNINWEPTIGFLNFKLNNKILLHFNIREYVTVLNSNDGNNWGSEVLLYQFNNTPRPLIFKIKFQSNGFDIIYQNNKITTFPNRFNITNPDDITTESSSGITAIKVINEDQKFNLTVQWEPVREFSCCVIGITQLNDGTILGIGTDYNLWSKSNLSQNWVGAIQNSCCVIDITQLNDGTLLGIGTDYTLWSKRNITDNWNGPIQNSCCVKSITQLKDGTLLGIGTDNTLWSKRNLTDYWNGPIQNSCCVIDITQLSDGTILGIGTDLKLWSKKNLTDNWTGPIENSCCVKSIIQLQDGKLLGIGTDNKLYTKDILIQKKIETAADIAKCDRKSNEYCIFKDYTKIGDFYCASPPETGSNYNYAGLNGYDNQQFKDWLKALYDRNAGSDPQKGEKANVYEYYNRCKDFHGYEYLKDLNFQDPFRRPDPTKKSDRVNYRLQYNNTGKNFNNLLYYPISGCFQVNGQNECMDYNTNKYLKAPLSPLIIFYLDQNYSTKEFKIIAEGDTIWSSNNQLVFDNNFCYFNQLPNPHDMDLSEFQKLWNSIGCKSQLNNDSIKSWRNQTFEKVISDMLNYQRLTSNCSGNDAQNEFCRPGECHNTSTMPLSDFQSIWNQAGCKSQLTENDIKIWRHKKYEEVQADIARYGQLSSNCEGDETINELCRPGECYPNIDPLEDTNYGLCPNGKNNKKNSWGSNCPTIVESGISKTNKICPTNDEAPICPSGTKICPSTQNKSLCYDPNYNQMVSTYFVEFSDYCPQTRKGKKDGNNPYEIDGTFVWKKNSGKDNCPVEYVDASTIIDNTNCEKTTYGCCPDNQTPKNNPQGDNCINYSREECIKSKYGCCPGTTVKKEYVCENDTTDFCKNGKNKYLTNCELNNLGIGDPNAYSIKNGNSCSSKSDCGPIEDCINGFCKLINWEYYNMPNNVKQDFVNEKSGESLNDIICGKNNPSGKNESCHNDYEPVCGSDGKTYKNDCIAKNSGAEIQYFGACDNLIENFISTESLMPNKNYSNNWTKILFFFTLIIFLLFIVKKIGLKNIL